jgi:hypothetical protein
MADRKHELTHFGQEVQSLLSIHSMSQATLARAMDKNPNHLNHVMYARYSRPTPSWADLVANALGLSADARRQLHRAAARDQGFKL